MRNVVAIVIRAVGGGIAFEQEEFRLRTNVVLPAAFRDLGKDALQVLFFYSVS